MNGLTRRFSVRLATVLTLALAAAMVVGYLSPSGSASPAQEAPRNTTAPSIEGTARQGETLTAQNGVWAGNPTSFSYRWVRCDEAGQNCATIEGATSRTYTLAAADVGRRIRVLVTGTNASGSSQPTNSAPTAPVSGTAAPASTERPTVSGTAQVGAELTASQGRWSGTPTRFTYQWQRCDRNGANCANVSGATSQRYGVRAADQGSTLRVQVTATNANGSAAVTSDRTDVVRAAGAGGGGAGPLAGNSVDVTSVALPNRLVVSRVGFLPRVIRSRDVPVTMLVRVTDSQGRLVRDALVYVVGLPYGRIANVPEVRTARNGVATLTLTPTRLLPLQRGATLVLFVRARKPNDSLIAGVSTRRLVQIRIDPTR